MNAHVPIPLIHSFQLYGFLRQERGYKTWLIKRKEKQDIIGFAVHGNFIPGLPNNIGFNIGLEYTRQGYAKETLIALVDYLRNEGLQETFGHCFESNSPSIRTMESVGFEKIGPTGRIFNGINELKFKIEL
jgi:RimJ/RimL family protein N-acetyltransferase